MTGQFKSITENIINSIKESEKEKIINIDDYDIIVFRNLYHIAKNIDDTLDVEIIEKGKIFRVFSKV